MASEIFVNTGYSNGLLPDSTKPLPEPMLTSNYKGPGAFYFTLGTQATIVHE